MLTPFSFVLAVLIGDVTPKIGEYDIIDNPLQKVGVVQSIYFALVPEDIVKRVKVRHKDSKEHETLPSSTVFPCFDF